MASQVFPRFVAALSGVAFLRLFSCSALAAPPTYDHVVIVMEENHSLTQIIGNRTEAPYINQLADGGVSFNGMTGVIHPSHPNYLELFSGSNQGVTDDSSGYSFSTPNLGAALIASGRTFAGFAENLPAIGDTTTNTSFDGLYVRYHCPWVPWVSTVTPLPANKLAPTVHRRFADFPANFASLPTVSIVVPNYIHDMHSGSFPVKDGDTWLKNNLSTYAEWAKTHNSLLIVTWDEDEFQTANRIPTIFYGANVRNGFNGGAWTLHNILRTIEDMYALPHSGRSAFVSPITGAFSGESPVGTLTFSQGVNGYVSAYDTQLSQAFPSTSYATATSITAAAPSASNAVQGLIRFENLFGSGANRLAANAQILSAKLKITTSGAAGSLSPANIEIHRMLVPWTDGSTWNSLVGGVSNNGIESAQAADFTAVPSFVSTLSFDVTATVRQWAAGAPNYGWVVQAVSTDGWIWLSSESGARPTLEISFATSEFSIDPGTPTIDEKAGSASFTVHRTGASPTDVSVLYTTQGINASVNLDYTATSGTLSWAAGDLSDRVLTVPILADTLVEPDEDFFFYVYSATGGANLAANYYSYITIRETPFNKWLFSKFGANANDPIAAASADPDGDGASNLIEYATGSEPRSASSLFAPLPISGSSLLLSFRRMPANTDLVYTVQISTDLVNWSDGSSYFDGGSIPSNAMTTEVSRSGTSPETIVVRDNTPFRAGGPRAMRLRVTHP